jgi:hypothetical protein
MTMAEARGNAQLPIGATIQNVLGEELQAFQQGIELGRKYADVALRRVAAWAEENPGGVVLAGLAAGFLFGKVVFHKRRPRLADLDLD